MLPLRIGGDAVHAEELARLSAAVAEARQDLEGVTLDDVHLLVHPIGQVEVGLLRVTRERDVPGRSRPQGLLRDEDFPHKGAVRAEHLNSVVRAVADVEEAVVRQFGAMDRIAELLRRRCVRIVSGQLTIVRPVAIRAPIPLELTGIRVDHRNALIAVAVSQVGFVGARVPRRSWPPGRSFHGRGCRRWRPHARPAGGTSRHA